jgi:hypothetical protein
VPLADGELLAHVGHILGDDFAAVAVDELAGADGVRGSEACGVSVGLLRWRCY